MHAIGCDVGSQSLKGVLVDPGGRVVAEASAAYDVAYPHPGWAEQDPQLWRTALATVVRRLVADAQITPTEVATLALASQVDGVVPIDAAGDALAPAIIWLDRRATAETAHVRELLDADAVRATTGLNIDASHLLPKLLWLRSAMPDVFGAAAALLPPGGALVSWMTGEHVVDHANASSTLLYDLATRDWSPALCEATGIDPARLGRVADSTAVAGSLRPAAAAVLGLTPSTQVLVGTGDEHGASLGAGGVRPGIVIDITGTAEPVAVGSREPVLDPTGLVETHGHADPRAFLIENPGFVSGGSVRWFLDTFGPLTAAQLDGLALSVAPGSDGVTFLPTLSGATAPRWNDQARGTYAGLSLTHGLAHLARALLEGCTFALRDIVDRLAELGLADEEIRVVGGGARSPLWLRMKADVTGRPVRVLTTAEATATGAAMLAATAAGTFRDLDEAIETLVRLDPAVIEPDTATCPAYDDAYGRYRELFDAIEPTWGGGGRRPTDASAAATGAAGAPDTMAALLGALR